MKIISILLVEDDELFRLGLSMRLQREKDLQVVAEAEDGETALDLAKQQKLDLIILDIGLPGMGGIEACRILKKQHPELPILVLTSHSEKSLICKLIEAGAAGYCLKGIAGESLILAIRSVATGASWWDKVATQEIRHTFTESHPIANDKTTESSQEILTKREQEILEMLGEGKSNQEIATALYIAPGTVRVHVHAILQKLNARDRTQAALIAREKKLIDQQLFT